jgi:hypothetical protein
LRPPLAAFLNDVEELTDLERELLELISMAGEPTTVLDEEMLKSSPGELRWKRRLEDCLAAGC